MTVKQAEEKLPSVTKPLVQGCSIAKSVSGYFVAYKLSLVFKAMFERCHNTLSIMRKWAWNTTGKIANFETIS